MVRAMCGRFTLTIPSYDELARRLDVAPVPEDAALYRPRFNVAPTDLHWIVRAATPEAADLPGATGPEPARRLEPARFGLVNYWAKDASRAGQQINARAESVAEKPAFREAYAKRRCVVPVDGWLEWFGPTKTRRPVWFRHADGSLTLLAGMYEDWRNPETREKVRTFSLITTEATGLPASVHDRMPVRVARSRVTDWLLARASVGDLIGAPMDDETVVGNEVSRRVNSVKNDDPACLAPPEKIEPGETGSLF
jgi:putative SOS response-associated peptidase YedK